MGPGRSLAGVVKEAVPSPDPQGYQAQEFHR